MTFREEDEKRESEAWHFSTGFLCGVFFGMILLVEILVIAGKLK